jgi:hypothetical protein
MTGGTKISKQWKQDTPIQDIIQHLPLYAGMFDPHAYIDWELKVDVEFDNHDLTEHQMIFVVPILVL